MECVHLVSTITLCRGVEVKIARKPGGNNIGRELPRGLSAQLRSFFGVLCRLHDNRCYICQVEISESNVGPETRNMMLDHVIGHVSKSFSSSLGIGVLDR